MLGGSAVSGKLKPPTTDLDVLVIDDGPWTIRRETRRGVEVHWTTGSESAWRAVLEREVSTPLGANISLLAGSMPLADPDGISLRLMSEVRTLHDQGPQLNTAWMETRRRHITELVVDLLQSPLESQPYICSLLVILTVPSASSFQGQWQPRHKEAMELLSRTNPGLYGAIDRALREHSVQAYSELKHQIGILLEPVGGWAGPHL